MSSVLPITMSSSDALLEDTMMKIAKSAFDTAGNGGKQLRPDVLKSAFFLMHIKIDNEEGERILRKFDVNNNAGLEMNEFLRCARSAHPPNTISCKFKELTESGSQHEFLDGQQARKLLQRLGHVYSVKEIDKLLGRCTTTDNSGDENPRFTLEDICRLTSAAVLFLHEDPIPPPTPATWNELVLAMHTILGALATSVLVFFSLKPTAEAQSAAPTIPFIHQLPNARVTDAVLMVCLCGWGGFHVLSLASRGTRKGIAMDCIALACGLIVLAALIWFVNPWMVTIPVLMSCLVGVGLWALGSFGPICY